MSEDEAAVVREGVLRLSRRLQGERPADGLSLTKISVLGHLTRHGPATAGELAARDRLRPQSVTRVLAELDRDGLIERLPAADRRQRRFGITATGRVALTGDMRHRDRWLAQALDRELTAAERADLLRAARLLYRLGDSVSS